MITDVIVIYNDDSQIKQLGDMKISPNFVFIDDRINKNKRKAFMLKSHWAAKLTPFAICMDGETPIKVFYSEAENVVESLIKYLNE